RPAAGCQRRGLWRGITVHLARPLREHGDRAVADILPEPGELLVQTWRIEQVGHRLPGRWDAAQLRPDRYDIPVEFLDAGGDQGPGHADKLGRDHHLRDVAITIVRRERRAERLAGRQAGLDQ